MHQGLENPCMCVCVYIDQKLLVVQSYFITSTLLYLQDCNTVNAMFSFSIQYLSCCPHTFEPPPPPASGLYPPFGLSPTLPLSYCSSIHKKSLKSYQKSFINNSTVKRTKSMYCFNQKIVIGSQEEQVNVNFNPKQLNSWYINFNHYVKIKIKSGMKVINYACFMLEEKATRSVKKNRSVS